MTKTEKIAREINVFVLKLYGSVKFYGDWFGRPMDNCHIITGARAEGDCLTIRFKEDETLKVWDPDGLKIDIKKGKLKISKALRVRWEWFYYGRPQTPENLFFIEYTPGPSDVRVNTDADWDVSKHETSLQEPAVELLRNIELINSNSDKENSQV